MKQFKFKSLLHTLFAILIPCLIFYFSHHKLAEKAVDTDKTCLYVAVNTCLVEKDKEFTKADISKVDPKLLILNTKIVYDKVTRKEQLNTFYILMIPLMLFLGILIRFPMIIGYVFIGIVEALN